MKNFTSLLTLFLLTGWAFFAIGCSSDDDNGNGNGGDGDGQDEWVPAEPTLPTSSDFQLTELTGYPEGLNVYSFTHQISSSVQTLGFVAICDFNEGTPFSFVPYPSQTARTPTALFAEMKEHGDRGEPLVVTNAGYFYGSTSLSMLILKGLKYFNENSVVGGSVDGSSTTNVVNAYPVRANFGQMSDGSFEVQWIYCIDTDGEWTDRLRQPYAYPDTNGNDERTGTYNPSPPTGKEQGAFLWRPWNSIGGGPMLLKNGQNVAENSFWEEVFYAGGVSGMTRQPRTCIGATAENQIVLLVCDGRQMRGSSGYTLPEMAEVLKGFGVVNAINLDGGGSSTFVGKEGEVLNRPSDTQQETTIKQRAVPTAVAFTKK